MRVLILDQFSGISPWDLQQRPRLFEEVAAEALAQPHVPWRNPEVKDINPDTFVVEMCTTIFKADANGYAELWRARWDSSG